MAHGEEVEWEDCCVEPERDPEIERFARREIGFVPPLVRYLSASPWVARAAVRLSTRGLGDEPSEREASRLLAAEGFAADDLEEVLSHLSSPRLDAVEAEAVPFARETVHYRPAPIQRRVRALGEKLEPAQQIGLIGIASVANMLSRLGVLVAG